jgi:hypothetical protein
VEENVLPTFIFMLQSEDAGIHYVVSIGYLLFLLPFIVAVTGTVGIPCFIHNDNPN